jgi:23S rRNA pseudouridine1911/1915/1917 synthase
MSGSSENKPRRRTNSSFSMSCFRAWSWSSGLPVVGDKMYGTDPSIYDRFVRHEMTDHDRAQLRLQRHALHAEQLRFAHPEDGREVRVLAPLPADLTEFLAV